MAARAGFVWLMPPEAESPAAVVDGASRRFAMPSMRVCTRAPEPAGAEVLAVVAFFGAGRFAAGALAALLRVVAAAFFVVLAAAFFAVPPFGEGLALAAFFALVFFARLAALGRAPVFLAGFAFLLLLLLLLLLDLRAAISSCSSPVGMRIASGAA
jgi:hypothetical protein